MDRLYILAEHLAGKELEHLLNSIFEAVINERNCSEKTKRLLLRVLKGVAVIFEAALLYKLKSTFGEYLMGLERDKVQLQGFLVYHLLAEPLLHRILKHFFIQLDYIQKAFILAFLAFKAPISIEHLFSGSNLEIRKQYFNINGKSATQYLYGLIWPTVITGIIQGLLEWTTAAKNRQKEDSNEWLHIKPTSTLKLQAPVEQRGKCATCFKAFSSRAHLAQNAYAYCSLECIPDSLSNNSITLHL